MIQNASLEEGMSRSAQKKVRFRLLEEERMCALSVLSGFQDDARHPEMVHHERSDASPTSCTSLNGHINICVFRNDVEYLLRESHSTSLASIGDLIICLLLIVSYANRGSLQVSVHLSSSFQRFRPPAF